MAQHQLRPSFFSLLKTFEVQRDAREMTVACRRDLRAFLADFCKPPTFLGATKTILKTECLHLLKPLQVGMGHEAWEAVRGVIHGTEFC